MIEKILSRHLAGYLAFSLLAGVFAQTTEFKSQNEKSTPTYLRGWIVGGGDPAAVSLMAKGPSEETPLMMSSSVAGEKAINQGYMENVVGSFQFQLRNGQKILQSATAELAANAAHTVLAWQQDGKWELKVYADGPFVENAMDRPVRLMNFTENRGTLVSLDNGPEKKVAPNTVQEFKMPAKSASFTVKVLALDGGPAAQSSGELDFASYTSAYILVAPDYRGRMRPRVIKGGNLPVVDE
jgi:hypothetical protein